MKICFVASVPFAVNAFIAPVILALVDAGWHVTVVVNCDSQPLAHDITRRAEVLDVKFARNISPLRDIRSLRTLNRIFREKQFDIVHSLMPKTGLLAMLAARRQSVPIRVHTFTGQVWATKSGVFKLLLVCMDMLISRCATALLTDSQSQKDFLVRHRVAKPNRLKVLGSGSIVGVDTQRFAPHPHWRQQVRQDLSIPISAFVIIYVGRMNVEKGVAELCMAFNSLASKLPNAQLLLVGPDDGMLQATLKTAVLASDRVHLIGWTAEPEKYLAAADVFCLASYREGFGLSLIEAAASGLPSVASKIYGVTDAVVDGVTGFLTPVGDVAAISSALAMLAEYPNLREKMGCEARKRAQANFTQQQVVAAWLDFYKLQSNLT